MSEWGTLGTVIDAYFGGSGGSMIGGALDQNNATGAAGQAQLNSLSEARAFRDVQIQQDNSAVQRRVADLQAAGINPMLAAQPGGSAGSPTQAAARVEDSMTPSMSSAAVIAQTRAATQQLQAATDKTKSETVLNASLAEKAHADTMQSTNNASYISTLENKVGPEVEKIIADADLSTAQASKIRAEIPNVILGRQKTIAETGNAMADARLKAVSTVLRSTELPGASNQSAADSSWYGKYIRPFLPDVLKSTSTAASVAR